MTTKDSEARLTNLPAWARNEIKALRQQLDAANAKLAIGPEDSDTIADPDAEWTGGTPKPLGKGPKVRFLLQPGNPRPGITVRTKDGELLIHADRPMHIRPSVSNMVTIGLDPR